MEFLEKNIRSIAAGFFALIVIGLGVAMATTYKKHKEEKSQESLAQIEFDYTKYKENLAKSLGPVPPKIQDKDQDKAQQKAEPPVDLKAQALESRAKLISNLNLFVAGNKDSIATRMASLYLSELQLDDNKKAEALVTLKNVDTHSKDLTSILVQKKLGALLADNGQCDEALKIWDNVLKLNAAQFAFAEVKIMQSLCYQKMNDLKKAEEILLSVKNDKTEGSAEFVQHADRILRLIQFKKASGT